MDDLPIVVERCENRASVLGNKLLEVSKSMQTVHESCKNAKLSLDIHYEKIKKDVIRALEERHSNLIDFIDKASKKDMKLLDDLKSQLQNDLGKVNELIMKGKQVDTEKKASLENDVSNDVTGVSLTDEIQLQLDKLNKNHTDILCSSMSISINSDDQKLQSSIEGIKSCIDVNLVGGLDITNCIEMPGGIIIKWDEPSADIESIETDNSIITEYTLQYSLTPFSHSNLESYNDSDLVFNTLYTGEEMQYFMSEVEINRSYYFRVCKSRTKSGFPGVCEPWSMPKRGWTTLSPYAWSLEDCLNESNLTIYELGNENKTATKVFPESCKVLRSSNASYRIGHVLNFKIDEAGERSSKDGIGLITKRFEKSSGELLISSSDSIVVNSKGAIYVNGSVMTMKLPVFKRGSTLSFQTSQLLPGKLRVTISSEDKEVTFDWVTGENDCEFSFASSFEHTGWQVTVS